MIIDSTLHVSEMLALITAFLPVLDTAQKDRVNLRIFLLLMQLADSANIGFIRKPKAYDGQFETPAMK